jgi:DNA-binding LacI/PurR family transcriptional regulator
MQINPKSSTPLYIQLVEGLLAQIESGIFPPGSRLPPELKLAAAHEVSRGTVREALGLLEKRGYIDRIPGKGTFIREIAELKAVQKVIGVILPWSHFGVAKQIRKGVIKTARENGYSAEFHNTENRIDQQNEFIRTMRRRGAKGFIIMPPSGVSQDQSLEELAKENFPLVVVDRTIPTLDVDSVVANNFDGGYTITQHLIALGHKRIGFITSTSLKTPPIAERFRGYKKALDENGITLNEEWVFDLSNDLKKCLTMPNRPTAIFAINDHDASMVIDAAMDLNLDVPKDLSVAGFDDSPIAGRYLRPITTVKQPGEEIGRRAVEILLDRLKVPQRPHRHEMLAVEFVPRKSTAPPPDGAKDEEKD